MNAAELIKRIQRKIDLGTEYPTKEYQTYCRWMRQWLKLDRRNAAAKAGLDYDFFLWLENGNLYHDELTDEIKDKIAAVFGISFEEFMDANKTQVEQFLTELAEIEKQTEEELSKEFDYE